MKPSILRRLLLAVPLALVLVLPTACATAFTGAPHYPGGPRACHADCARQNMEMSSFIYSGEFATSCVCRPRMSPAPVAPPPADTPAPATPATPPPSAARPDDRAERDAADAAAAAGVVMQERRAAARQQAAAGGAQ